MDLRREGDQPSFHVLNAVSMAFPYSRIFTEYLFSLDIGRRRVAEVPWARIVVVNYNSGDLLARTVACLAAQSDPDFEVVIVDNGSTDGSPRRLVLPDARFSLLRMGENLGFAAGSNLGLQGTATDWVATLNPDAFPSPNWLAALRRAVTRYPTATMFGSLQIDVRDPTRLDGCGDGYAFFGIAWRGGHGQRFGAAPLEGECFSPCGAAALYKRDEFEVVGGFDERYFCYYEDVDLGFRLRLRGGRCVQVGDAVVHHVGSAVTGHDSPFTVFHSERNRLWTYVKNMPSVLLWVFFPVHLAATAYILWKARGSDRWRPMLNGLFTAIRGLAPILAERRRLQQHRSVSVWTIAKALTWNVKKVRRQEPDLHTF